MNRIIAILLIPFFVVSNVLAHSHGAAAHYSNGQTRSHIHVSGGAQHDHESHNHESHEHGSHEHGSHDHESHGHESHGHSHHSRHHDHQQHDPDQQNHDHDEKSTDSLPVAPVEHDSDAVYLVAADSLFTTSERWVMDLDSQFLHAMVICVVTVPKHPSNHNAPPFFSTAELPLYLLYAALRL
jgi:hypothetical protein